MGTMKLSVQALPGPQGLGWVCAQHSAVAGYVHHTPGGMEELFQAPGGQRR